MYLLDNWPTTLAHHCVPDKRLGRNIKIIFIIVRSVGLVMISNWVTWDQSWIIDAVQLPETSYCTYLSCLVGDYQDSFFSPHIRLPRSSMCTKSSLANMKLMHGIFRHFLTSMANKLNYGYVNTASSTWSLREPTRSTWESVQCVSHQEKKFIARELYQFTKLMEKNTR